MAVSKWFDSNVYLLNKVAQLKETEPSGNWTVDKVVQAFAALGFVGPEGAEAHFMQFGQYEDVAPNAFFNPTEYYRAKAAEVNNKQDNPKSVTEGEAAFVKAAIKGLGMGAWTHYDTFGSDEKINPSNSFDTVKYMNAKLDALNANLAADQPKYKIEDVYAAFKASGMSALEHFLTFGGTGNGEVIQKVVDGKIPADFAVDPAKQVNGGGSSDGDLYTLTEKADVVKGTSADDTIIGYADATAATSTYQSSDTIDGGAGIDTLRLTVGGASTQVANITNVEILSARSTSATAELDASAKSFTKLVNDGSANAMKFTNIGKVTDLAIANTSSTTEFVYADNALGTAKATVNLNLTDVSSNATVTIAHTSAGSDKITTMNINASGKNSITTAAASDIAWQHVENLNITGDGSVKITSDGTTSLDAVKNITVTAAKGADIDLATGGNAQAVTFKGGDGDDTLRLGAGLTTADQLDGGKGINTLGVTDGSTLLTGLHVTNFQILDIGGGAISGATSYDMSYLKGITTLKVGSAINAHASNDDTTTIDNLAKDANVLISAALGTGTGDKLIINQATGGTPSANTSLTVELSGKTAVTTTGDLEIDGITTISFKATGDGATDTVTHTITNLGAKNTTGIKVLDGDANLVIASLDAATSAKDIVGLVTFDASEASKDVSLTTGTIAFSNTAGTAFTLGKGNDVLNLTGATSASAGDRLFYINGGAGGDTITLSAAGQAEELIYKAATDSQVGAKHFDSIANFTKGEDKINVKALKLQGDTSALLDQTGKNASVNNADGTVASTEHTNWFTKAGTKYAVAVVETVSGAANAGEAWVYIDTNADGSLDSGDMAIKLTAIVTSGAGLDGIAHTDFMF